MRYVPAKEKTAWRRRAMEASEKGDLSSQIELWLEKKENDRLVSRLRRATDKELEGLSHYWTQPLARKLERPHPAISARLYRALCMRIVNAGKSKYYDAALDNIDHANFISHKLCVFYWQCNTCENCENLMDSLNSKFEFRNSKQIRMTKIRMTKTKERDLVAVCFVFWTF